MRLDKQYVASAADIADLTRAVVQAAATSSEGRGRYLNALIGTTQARLGSTSRRRAGAVSRTTTTECDRQQEVLKAVHKEFNASVREAAYETLKSLGMSCSSVEVNRRTNFARSSMCVLLKWVRARNDITNLIAGRTTKGMLAIAPRGGRPPSTRILTSQLERLVKRMKPVTIALYTADKGTARSQWERFKEEIDELLSGKRATVTRSQRDGREDRKAAN